MWLHTSFGIRIGSMEGELSFTVISEGAPAPSATVVDNVLDALNLAKHEAEKKRREVIVTTDTGWYLTLDELEELVRQ